MEYSVQFSHYPATLRDNICMLPVKKRHYLYTADEVNNGMKEDLQKLKRIKLTDSTLDTSEGIAQNTCAEEDNPCQALIVRPVNVDERSLAAAVLADYPKSALARIINLHLPDLDVSSTEKDDNRESQALIPYLPMDVLVKEASFEEEHAMDTD